MSRIEPQEYEYPPGLPGVRSLNNNDREQMSFGGYHQAPSYSLQDRRPSLAILGYPGYGGSMPRSLGVQERDYGFGVDSGPNRHNANPSVSSQTTQSFSSFNHHRPSPPPTSQSTQNSFYHSTKFNDRDAHIYRHSHNPVTNTPSPPTHIHTSRSTLWWGEIEPWMDEEYAKQVCGLMGWDPVSVKVPHPAPDPVTGQQANNPGYCFLTFPTPAHAASVLAQINGGGTNNPVTMPNSAKPFVLNWASSVPPVPPMSNSLSGVATGALQQYPKEYSIFVGDLAPETSNSDLVAVFRNPVLGLRNDREPKFISPFLSCKSAKIMLDPVTGVSRGYGFVRFTDEADQQRALIEMHGLYCLSRPMRISPATAKFKPPQAVPSLELPQVQFPSSNVNGLEQQPQPVTIALPLPNSSQTRSVSVPIAATTSNSSINSNGVSNSSSGSASIGASNSSNSLSSGTGTGSSTSVSTSGFGSITPEEMMTLPNNVLAQIAQQYASGEISPIKANGGNSISSTLTQDGPLRQSFGYGEGGAPRYTISEESWKHHAQARAILGNLIGPNGEQLTSTDPYNTTVFVGGLSPLISEETLRTFFAPFGDIHYVKVPVGKHCGFVQFVRKADAERAIEKMQGFPIGGSRIRLSWGRSQYKAAQAAAQAAQAAALQSQFSAPAAPTAANAMTQEQAIQLLQKLNLQYVDNNGTTSSDGSGSDTAAYGNVMPAGMFGEYKVHVPLLATRDDGSQSYESYSSNSFTSRPETHRTQPTFAPFSPDPNAHVSDLKNRDTFFRMETLPHPSKSYAPGFFPAETNSLNASTSGTALVKPPPNLPRPLSATRYHSFLDTANTSVPLNRASGRLEVPISRPSSGQTRVSGTQTDHEGQEPDMHDLNGTLASLELDRQWRSPSDSAGSSSGSIQFLLTRTPSPRDK